MGLITVEFCCVTGLITVQFNSDLVFNLLSGCSQVYLGGFRFISDMMCEVSRWQQIDTRANPANQIKPEAADRGHINTSKTFRGKLQLHTSSSIYTFGTSFTALSFMGLTLKKRPLSITSFCHGKILFYWDICSSAHSINFRTF